MTCIRTLAYLPVIASLFLAGEIAPTAAAGTEQNRDQNRVSCLSNDPDIAIAGCTALLQSGQESDDAVLAVALHNRGGAYVGKGQYDMAFADYTQAIRLKPRYADAFNGRCWEQAIAGQLAAALADCDQALQLKPDDADALDSRGFVKLRMGKYADAIVDYNAALSVNPKLAGSLYGRGVAKRKAGDMVGGAADIVAARAIDPGVVATFAKYGVTS